MKTLLTAILLLSFIFGQSQIFMDLTPKGFAEIKINKPKRPVEELIKTAKDWNYANNFDKISTVYDVTATGLKIDAMRNNAFFYRSRGEKYVYQIKYTLVVEFMPETYTVKFLVPEIYGKEKLTENKISDYFTSEGKVKQDFENVKPSLEKTANTIVNSFADFMATP